jgi:universal stress protein E
VKLERIVVGIDFSQPSVEAARWVATVLAPQAELVLAHVIDIPQPPGVLRALAKPTDALESTAHEGADRKLREVSRAAQVMRSWIEVRRGSASETLVAIANDYRADLLVVGSHRERGTLRNWLGSTAERLVRLSKIPVLLAANPADVAPRHVLAAVDGSSISAAVAAWASSLARFFHAELTRLSVVSSSAPTSMLAEAERAPASQPEGRSQSAPGERGENTSTPDPVLDGTTDSAAEFTFGEPGQEILAAAERKGSGLIVVGRHGTRRALFGSVSKEVLRGALCPVLVIVDSDTA